MTRTHRIFAALYDRMTAPLERSVLAALRAELVGPLTGVVVEIGAGTGANLPHYQAVGSLMLVEPDAAMARRLRRRLAGMPRAPGEPAAEVWSGTLESARITDQSVDAVVCTLVLCSVVDPERLLGEIQRILRPGGALVIIEHVRDQGRAGAAIQTLLTPAQRLCAGGCRLNRRTGDAITAAGFDMSEVRAVRIFSGLQCLAAGIAGVAYASRLRSEAGTAESPGR